MTQNKYRLSLTSAYFSFNETVLVANEYIKKHNWEITKENVIKNYLLGSENKNSNIRKFREIKTRLRELTEEEMTLLIGGSSEEQRAMIYLALCKTYQVLNEYVVEVLRVKILRFDYLLLDSDYSLYYQEKTEVSDKLKSISETTQLKIKRVIHKMLCEVGILKKDKEGYNIIPILLPSKIKNVIQQDNREWLKCFLLPDGEL